MRRIFSKGYFITVLYVGIAMLLVVVLLGRVLDATVEKEGLKAVRSSNELLHRELASHIGYWNEVNLALCRTIYNDNEVREILNQSSETDHFVVGNVVRRLQGMLVSSGMIDSIMLYNAALDEIYSTDPYELRSDLEIQEVLRSDRNRESVFMLVRKMEGIEEKTVLSYVIANRSISDQTIENAAVVNIKAERMLSSMTKEQTKEQRLQLVTQEGRILADDGGYGEDAVLSDQMMNLINGEESMGVLTVDGVKKVVNFCAVPGTDWKLVSYQPYEILYGMVDQIRAKNLWVMCAALVLSFLLTAAISYLVTRPLASLIQYVQTGYNGGRGLRRNKSNWKEVDFLKGVFEQQQKMLQQYEGYQENMDSTIQKLYLRNALVENGVGVYRPLHGLDQVKASIFEDGKELFFIFLSIANLQSLGKNDVVERDLIRFVVCNITDEILEEYGKREVLPMNGGNIIVLLEKQENDADGSICRSLLTNMIETVSRIADVSVSAFAGERRYHLEALGEYYSSFQKMSRYTLIYGSGCVLFESQLQEQGRRKLEYPQDRESAVVAGLNHGSEQETLEALSLFLEYIKKGNVESYLANVHRLLLELQNYVIRLNQHRLVKIQIEFGDIFTWTSSVETGEKVYQHLRNIVVSILDQMPGSVNQKNTVLIQGVKEYIHKNYGSKSLCSKMLAAQFGLSQSYLGGIFKDDTGYGVQEYINRVRLENAQKMVLNTKLLISEIMELCGLESSSFYRLYKSYFGVSPKEQRLQKRLEEKEECEDES